MRDTEVNKGGRPSRIEGEKAIKVSAAIRPRYRKALEIIARDRNMTISDAIELAILRLAENYKIDSEYVINMVRDENEFIERLYEAIDYPLLALRLRFKTPPKTQIFIDDLLGGFKASDPKALFISQILSSLKTKDTIVSFFDPSKLSKVFILEFLEGKTAQETLICMDALVSFCMSSKDLSLAVYNIQSMRDVKETLDKFFSSSQNTADLREFIKNSTGTNGKPLIKSLEKPKLNKSQILEIKRNINKKALDADFLSNINQSMEQLDSHIRFPI